MSAIGRLVSSLLHTLLLAARSAAATARRWCVAGFPTAASLEHCDCRFRPERTVLAHRLHDGLSAPGHLHPVLLSITCPPPGSAAAQARAAFLHPCNDVYNGVA